MVHGMTNVSIPEVNMLKYNSTFAIIVPRKVFIRMGFVPVNDPRVIYFMAVIRTLGIWRRKLE